MLTRFKVTGFKNLVDADVRFGPFTCIAGANGVGKSNLFDAIRFLGATADKTLLEAALSVRDEKGRSTEIRSLFHRHGDRIDPTMRFEAEMIVPPKAIDDLGQPATATTTFLRYTLVLGYRPPNEMGGEGLEVLAEDLAYIPRSNAKKHLWFAVGTESKEWKRSVLLGERRGPGYISTDEHGEGGTIIKRHQDGGSAGRPQKYSAKGLPRTVLSNSNAAESPTALAARRELQSWRLLQLEPSALRDPDEFNAPTRLGANGSHLAATLNRLCAGAGGEEARSRVLGELSNRLSELIPDIREIEVDRDDKRKLFTIQACEQDKTWFEARSLSDGTMRFLALAVLAQDPEETGLICLEEPENGIHPDRIPAFLRLLQDIALDTGYPSDSYNPMRQVIVNTHSPVVVGAVDEDALLIARSLDTVREGIRFNAVSFAALDRTWRTSPPKGANDPPAPVCAKGHLLGYLCGNSTEIDSESVANTEKPNKMNGPVERSGNFTRPRTVRQRFLAYDLFGEIGE